MKQQELKLDARIIQIPGAHVSERFSVVWHCPVCRRGASAFFSSFDEADAWMELVLRDLRCESCRRNATVQV